jgi:hypothetical protein
MDSQDEDRRRLVTADMMAGLPEPVQRYMAYTGLTGTPWIESVRLKQVGRFRLGADRPWMPLTAVETYTTDPPGLIWNARFKVAGLPILRARDCYEAGRGHMYGKLAGLLTVFDLRGDELDQATRVRYLNEMMWFPTALLGENVTWEAVDDDSARVVFDDGAGSVSATMHFDAEGKLINFTAMRYREAGGVFSLDPWSTPMTGYGEFAGLKLPTRGRAVWHLPGGDLSYAELEITEIQYNPAP